MFNFFKSKTTNTAVVSNNLPSFDEYWQLQAHSKSLTREDFIIRAIMKAVRAKNKAGVARSVITSNLLMKYFTPITNDKKLANGMRPYFGLYRGLQNVNFGVLAGARSLQFQISEDELTQFKIILEDIFKNFVKNFDAVLDKKTHIYTFVRTDISPIQQAVQAGHSLLKLGKHVNDFDPDITSLILCEAYGENDLYDIQSYLEQNGIPCVAFSEPDIGNEITSVSTYPVSYHERKKFFQGFDKLELY